MAVQTVLNAAERELVRSAPMTREAVAERVHWLGAMFRAVQALSYGKGARDRDDAFSLICCANDLAERLADELDAELDPVQPIEHVQSGEH